MGQHLRVSELVPRGFLVDEVVDADSGIRICLRASSTRSCCPGCGAASMRVHSRYARQLADLPLSGKPVRLVIRARRFHCDAVLDRWIDYPRARQALHKLEDLLLFPKRARMPNLLIFGASGMGKTMIIEKFVRANPPNFDERSGIHHRPVIVVQMVPSPDEGRFYHRLLSAIGAPPPSRATLGQLETQALRLLQETAPRMLVIDEVQNLIAGTYREQRRMLNLLRFLGNELRIPLICLGSHEARDAIRGDAHLNSRFEPYGLPPWRHDADFHGLIGGLLYSLPLRLPSELTDSALKRLVEVNGGITASIFRMLIALASDAILTGTKRITPVAILDHRVAAPTTFAA